MVRSHILFLKVGGNQVFFHVGDDEIVLLHDLVAIIDAASMEKGQVNEFFLRQAQMRGAVEKTRESLVTSYVVTAHKVLASAISANTLRKRAEECHFDIGTSLT